MEPAMNTRRIAQLHRYLAGRSFYPLALSSSLACAVLAGRVVLSESLGFLFLVWNLFLAWIPYLLSLWVETAHRRRPRRWSIWLIAGVWLLFFPNAPYIVTDFVHLLYASGVPWWYDVGLIAIFAWTGCFLAVGSLHVMQGLVRRVAGRLSSWLFVLATACLSGLGVYLGRFGRWNSWDALVAPHHLLADIAASLTDRYVLREVAGVTGLFAALLIVCFVTFVSVGRQQAGGDLQGEGG
jgi:uncharacterized membrane protein